eukprot:scaffold1997_cov318-Pavlova_lutheri.AAC.7
MNGVTVAPYRRSDEAESEGTGIWLAWKADVALQREPMLVGDPNIVDLEQHLRVAAVLQGVIECLVELGGQFILGVIHAQLVRIDELGERLQHGQDLTLVVLHPVSQGKPTDLQLLEDPMGPGKVG